MPKRKISDLGPNECIHCPTEEAVLAIGGYIYREIGEAISNFKNGYVYFGFENNGQIYLRQRENDFGRKIYPRTDFVYELEEEKNITDPNQASSEVSRPGPFKTGDEVECQNKLRDEKRQRGLEFQGYSTDGSFIVYDRKISEFHVFDNCRFPIKKHQHTISCTDEVREKVKQIEGVEEE